jgi:hypothetical protein
MMTQPPSLSAAPAAGLPCSAQPTITLLDRLIIAADLWAAANGGTRSRLSRTVINDGGFFGRLESPGASTTTATLEKFARFLGDAANWPGGAVPQEVCAFIHVTGVSSAACAPSPDIAGPIIGAATASSGGAAAIDGGPSGRAPVLPESGLLTGPLRAVAGGAGVSVSDGEPQ